MKPILFLFILFVVSCSGKNDKSVSENEYAPAGLEDVNFNKYDSTDLVNGDKVYLTKFNAATSDSLIIGKSTVYDVIKLFGEGKMDTSLQEYPTASDNHYYYGKILWVEYESEGLTFSFFRAIRDGETPEELLVADDSCFLESIILRSPSNYYLDNVFIGMTYGAVIKKYGKPSFEITNGIVYRLYGLWLTFDREVYKNDESGKLLEISRSDRSWFIENNYPE